MRPARENSRNLSANPSLGSEQLWSETRESKRPEASQPEGFLPNQLRTRKAQCATTRTVGKVNGSDGQRHETSWLRCFLHMSRTSWTHFQTVRCLLKNSFERKSPLRSSCCPTQKQNGGLLQYQPRQAAEIEILTDQMPD